MLKTVAGAAIVVMGTLSLGTAFVTRLNREWRPPGLLSRAGWVGPVVAGAAFAIASAVGFGVATRSFRFLKRHWSAVQAGSGVVFFQDV